MNARPTSAHRSGRPTAVDQTVEALREGLLAHRFAPGQRLIEADLTERFGVSRSTLREAFRRLASDGLIEIVPNRGAIVRSLSPRDRAELFLIRSELEALAARLAAEAMGEADKRERFEADVAEIWNDAARVEVAAYLQENARFHEAILRAGDNLQLTAICSQYHLHAIMGQVGNALSAAAMAQSVEEHRRLAEAILARRADDADRLMRDHLKRAAEISAN
jgi:DNA-binding GntR family transcriptional regulator